MSGSGEGFGEREAALRQAQGAEEAAGVEEQAALRQAQGAVEAARDAGAEWRRLHPMTTVAGTLQAAVLLGGAAVPTAIGMLIGGVSAGWVAFWVFGGLVVLTGGAALLEGIRVRATRWRITGDRIEQRFQLIGSSTKSLPLLRIRTVDITADLIVRPFGLAEVRLGTGDQSGNDFKITLLSREVAEDLRAGILGETARGAGADRTGRLATFDPSWIRYAPLSLGTPAIGLGAFGAVLEVADWFSAVPTVWTYVTDLLPGSLLLEILILFGVAMVIGVIGSLAVYVDSWWGYHLDRDPDGTLHVERGLLVRRTSSFHAARIRGVTLAEPLGYRKIGAGLLRVVAVGVETSEQDESKQQRNSTIVPPSPREVSIGVAEVILDHPFPTDLRAHPPAAARRRYRWSAMIFVAVLVLLSVPAVLWSAELWWLVGGAALLGLPITWVLARDSAAGLGHLITDDFVVLRSGSVFRSTDVLSRAGLLGWNMDSSPFQRRAGLVTLTATSAAAPGHFRLPDVGIGQAAEVQRTSGDVWDHLWVG